MVVLLEIGDWTGETEHMVAEQSAVLVRMLPGEAPRLTFSVVWKAVRRSSMLGPGTVKNQDLPIPPDVADVIHCWTQEETDGRMIQYYRFEGSRLEGTVF